MRIVPGLSSQTEKTVTGAAESARVSTPSAATTAASADNVPQALQSAQLQPALQAIDALPDVDQAKVQAVREALAKGEMPFDAAKLAALIESYHRSGT